MPAIWQYPPEIMAELQRPVSSEQRARSQQLLRERHEETLARIDARIAAAQKLAAERRMALYWCRANGNPHLKGE